MLRFGQNLELQLHVSSELRHTGSLLLQTLVRPCHVHTCSALRSAWQKWDRGSFSTERGCLRAGVRLEPRAPRNRVTWSPLCPHGLPRFSAPRGPACPEPHFTVGSRRRAVQQLPSTAWWGTVLSCGGSRALHSVAHRAPCTAHDALALSVLECTDSGSQCSHTAPDCDPWHVPRDHATCDVITPSRSLPTWSTWTRAQVHECAVTKCEEHPRGLLDMGVTSRLLRRGGVSSKPEGRAGVTHRRKEERALQVGHLCAWRPQ